MFGKGKTCHFAAVPERCLAECNLVILGVMGSGKSALTVKFLTKRFISEYDPNLEDIYSSEEIVDHQPVMVKVMDTADQDGPVNCERYLTWASGYLVVYSIDNRQSFQGCQQYLEALALHSASLAARFGGLFYEVSACLDFLSVQRVFHDAVREVRREADRCPPFPSLCVGEDRPLVGFSSTSPFAAPCFKELPTPATAKLITVKSSRAQSKRRAPTLTLLKGFKIF
ncbi:hypothetical protein NHX12_005351 [Muraenolepis orangiensis]|uniref:small monomeric GTPase n=1 Tax=Muraenolepis orangiensis TaxID=630683 RepID=A0A9Q0DSZ8_9TELE|nr:hypothetical protein NHX12_005351 [Muraenolepis orangiensis]